MKLKGKKRKRFQPDQYSTYGADEGKTKNMMYLKAHPSECAVSKKNPAYPGNRKGE